MSGKLKIGFLIRLRDLPVSSLVFLLIFVFPFSGFAQKTVDTATINRINEFAESAYQRNDLDSAIFYTDEAIKLSREISFKKGKADAFHIIAEIREKQNDLTMALRYYFGSVREYETANDSLQAARVKVRIGDVFFSSGMYEKALEYYLSAEKYLLLQNHEFDKDEVKLVESIAEVYYNLEEYDKSLKYYKRLEKIYSISGETVANIDVYHKIIKCNNNLKQFDNSLKYNLKILDYFRAKGDVEQEIVALNNTGFTYKHLNNYREALNYFKKARALEKETGEIKSYITLLNIAIVYQNMDDYKNALKYMLKAEQIAESSGDSFDAAKMDHLTSIIYLNNKDYYNAQTFNKEALRLAKKGNNTSVLIAALLVSSKINEALYDFEAAMTDYRLYLKISDSVTATANAKRRELLQQQFIIDRSEREIEKLLADEDLKDVEYQRMKLENATKEQQIQIFRQTDSIQKFTIENQNLEKQRVLQEKLLAEERLNAEVRDREISDLRQREIIQSLELEKQKSLQREKQNEIDLLSKEKEINDLNLKKIRARNKFLFGIIVLAIIILYLVYRMLKFSKKANKLLIQQNNEIERQRDEINYEHERSEKLLLNILPKETAEELKEKGSATPQHYEMVSVLFTDFVGFTKIAEKLTAEELVEELNKSFLEFDKIIDKYGLEKIKTIGDAYMCAGGIPVPNTTNPFDIVRAGLEIRDYMARLKEEKETRSEDFWELRIGIHTGDVIAGVVGKNKFAYDIWGDAVNTASRMESSGVPGKVNVSGATYELIKDKFRCTYRGKVKAKNKGEIDMYIVEEEI
jgi:class 3 adenylate cyclase